MAGRHIKGITIEIDGKTTGLQNALKNITTQSNKVQTELRAIERALKFDPGNTVLLAQKQELLAKQIELTAQKLRDMKIMALKKWGCLPKVATSTHYSIQKKIKISLFCLKSPVYGRN